MIFSKESRRYQGHVAIPLRDSDAVPSYDRVDTSIILSGTGGPKRELKRTDETQDSRV